MKCFHFILILITLCGRTCLGQGISDDNDQSRLVEELVGYQDLDADYEQIYENLMQIIANPVDLNTVNAEELRLLQILDEKQISEFLSYRNDQGSLYSIYELQVIPGFDPGIIKKLTPFVIVVDPAERINLSFAQRILSEDNNYFITRYERTLETKKGFVTSDDLEKKFSGSADKLYLRYRSSKANDYSLGFTAEKDAGEKLMWDRRSAQYGFDFLSYHFQLKNKGRLTNLTLGDFQCQFGQGLVLGGAFGLGKGSETITTVRRSNVGILPYTSSIEAGYYRGGGLTYRLHKNFFLTGFYSFSKRDASVQNDSLAETISSFQTTGFHRNMKELAYRKQVTENVYGAVLNYRKDNLDAGVIFHRIAFSNPVNKNPSRYNQFSFRGDHNNTISLFFNYTLGNANFFTEAASSITGGNGMIAGALIALHHNFDMAISYRRYDRNFYSFYGNAFAENSLAQNEHGFYWGWKYYWKRKIILSGYTDLFRFPWLGFRRYAPGHGFEWLLKLAYQPSRNIIMYFQIRQETKPRNDAEENTVYYTSPAVRHNYWFSANYKVTPTLTMKTRVQFNTFSISQAQTKGIALIQDITYRLNRFEVSARHALFDAQDYENRNYVYENDMWMAFSLPAYYGIGIRNYILLEYKVSKNLSVWFRYARTRYRDRDVIGSDVDSIAGNTRNDIKFQALFRF